MISMHQNRLNTEPTKMDREETKVQTNADRGMAVGNDIVAQVKKMAVAQPVVVVAAGLALGVLTGLILKRR